MQPRSLTETRNTKSINLDTMSTDELVKLFAQNERDVYRGHDLKSGLFSNQQELSSLANAFQRDLEAGRITRACLSGAGTSGRLCCITSALASTVYPGQRLIQYNINGGIGAFFRTPPGLEDDFEKGLSELTSPTLASSPLGLVGVSCGLSAPYIAGQIQGALSSERGPVGMLGFNPIDQARSEIRRQGSMSFRQVLDQAQGHRDFHPMTPIVGPELVAGSVRLKAGTATLLALGAVSLWLVGEKRRDAASFIAMCLDAAEEASDQFYHNNSELIGELVERAVSTLQAGDSIRLSGDGVLGYLAVTDAAECPPTFGAEYDEVIGSCDPSILRLGVEAGVERIDAIPIRRQGGLCVTEVVTRKQNDFALHLESGPSPRLYCRVGDKPSFDAPDQKRLFLAMNEDPAISALLIAAQIKLLFNTLSTATFARRGKIYTNIMTSHRVGNAKLFDRAVGIISELCRCDVSAARHSLLRSVYGADSETDIPDLSTTNHILNAARETELISTAICLQTNSRFRVADARELVARKVPLRHLLLGTEPPGALVKADWVQETSQT